MDKITQSIDSLNRAKQGDSLLNYPAIVQGFAAKGIAHNDIVPRVNIFTYNAWKALNRQVRKGEKGIKCVLGLKPIKMANPINYAVR